MNEYCTKMFQKHTKNVIPINLTCTDFKPKQTASKLTIYDCVQKLDENEVYVTN